MDDAAICLSRRWSVKRARGSGDEADVSGVSDLWATAPRKLIGVHVICFRQSGAEEFGGVKEISAELESGGEQVGPLVDAVRGGRLGGHQVRNGQRGGNQGGRSDAEGGAATPSTEVEKTAPAGREV